MDTEKNNQELILDLIKNILKAMSFSDCLVSFEETADYFVYDIYTDQARLLIGMGGENLDAFQYVVKLLARKTIENLPNFIVDVNGYRKERIQYLKDNLKNVVREVVKNKKAVDLEPMPAYERRIVHVELSMNPDVKTESAGEEPERFVRIIPNFQE